MSNPLNPNIPPFSGVTYSPGAVKTSLTDRSIVNLGSGSQVLLSGNPARNYLLIHNPSAVTIGINFNGATASVGSAGTVAIATLDKIVWEDNIIPTGVVTVCGTSGSGVTCYEA